MSVSCKSFLAARQTPARLTKKYVSSFLDRSAYVNLGSGREQLLAQFNIPDFVSNMSCTDLNGYFGSRTHSAPGAEALESSSAFLSPFPPLFCILLKA